MLSSLEKIRIYINVKLRVFDVNNMAYWITTSNWYTERVDGRPCSGAMQRNERQIWWYDRERDNNIRVGDMVLVYQGGDNVEARKEGIKIDNKIKCCFIGNFAIKRLIERNDPSPSGCPEEPDNDWLETVEQNFLWLPNRIIKRKTIGDGLLVIAAGRPDLDPKYVGLIFKNKTWIRLEGNEYYNLVMNRYLRNFNLP